MRRRRNAGTEPSTKTDLAGAEFTTFALEDAEDRRLLRTSLWTAVGVHVLLLLINFPAITSETQEIEKPKPRPFEVKIYRYEPPPPPTTPPIRQPRALRVPVPDPTPDGPELVPTEDPPPDIELPQVDVDFITIPDAPPSIEPQGPIPVGGDVHRPEKIHAPPPRYTEPARRARIEGVVIVEAIVDRNGDVTNARVRKGLPMGLSEEAVKAIKQWKFRPATLNGKPVDVYYNLTVNFRLQQ